MSDLNAKALTAAQVRFFECLECLGDGPDDMETGISEAIRTYLEASGIGAVVEAAREWENSGDAYVKSMLAWDSGHGLRDAVRDAEDKWDDAKDNLHAAVAALEDRHD